MQVYDTLSARFSYALDILSIAVKIIVRPKALPTISGLGEQFATIILHELAATGVAEAQRDRDRIRPLDLSLTYFHRSFLFTRTSTSLANPFDSCSCRIVVLVVERSSQNC